MTTPTPKGTIDRSRVAWILAVAGFVPFALLTFAIMAGGQSNPLSLSMLDLFKIWSAVVLSFLGGIRWGMAMAGETGSWRILAASTLAAVVGWFALMLPDRFGILVLLLAFCAHGAWDSFSANAGQAPAWYGKLRITLTFLVAAAHVIVFLILFQAA